MNIYEKLAAITSELDPVAKSLNVKIGNGSYKAVSEYSVLDAVKPLENKYKVYSYPVNRSIVNQCVMENDNGRKSVFVRVETTYRFVNIEKPEEFIDVISYGDGVDTQDKATGKAMTYADKYALMKAYKIQTGDDPDQWGSQDLKKVEPTRNYYSEVEVCTSAPTLTSILNDLNIDGGISFDKKLQLKRAIQDKAVSLGLKYNKDKKEFE